VKYPKHAFSPEDLLTFIELEGFSDDWADLELDDEDLEALQISIMMLPRGSPIVQGTGGLRKARFAPERWKTGKRGAARVGYVYLDQFGVVLLVLAYGKNEQDNIPPSHKTKIQDLIRRIKEEFTSRTIK
jgi:hypothetical protein